MRLPRFSIAALLLVVVIAALAAALFVEKRRYAALQQQTRAVRDELGHIDVLNPGMIHVRALRCEAQNAWMYRLYVPEDSDYVIEFYQNTGSPNMLGEQKPIAPDPGQNTITLQVAEDLLNPDDFSAQCFMVSLNNRRGGITLPRKHIRFLAGTTGNYENSAHRLDDFRLNNDRVDRYAPGKTVNLLHIRDQSNPPRMINGKPAEIIIRLIPKQAAAPGQAVAE